MNIESCKRYSSPSITNVCELENVIITASSPSSLSFSVKDSATAQSELEMEAKREFPADAIWDDED